MTRFIPKPADRQNRQAFLGFTVFVDYILHK